MPGLLVLPGFFYISDFWIFLLISFVPMITLILPQLAGYIR